MEELCDEVKTVRGFCYLRDRVNASDGREAAVTARAGIGVVIDRRFYMGVRHGVRGKMKLQF